MYISFTLGDADMIFSFLVLFLLVYTNGFSDAPNSVACAISSHAVEVKAAIRLAALFDMLGVLLFSLISPSVAYTCGSIVKIPNEGRYAILASMSTALIWALLAWKFGIPTSESHAMSAAISGAAFFLGGEINMQAWGRIFTGFFLFSALAFFISPLTARISEALLRKRSRRCRISFLSSAETLLCLLCSFMHGAQDGQKFIGMIMLFSGESTPTPLSVISCATVLSFGTLTCSKRIIKTTAFETVRLNMNESFASDLTSFFLMLTASLLGIPLSTSNVKCSAMIGTQSLSSHRAPNVKKAVFTMTVWILTFPCCFIIGGALSYLYSI